MHELTIPSASREFVRVPVAAREDGQVVDPNSGTVRMAFVAIGQAPKEDDWKAAEWETDADRYFARVLIGPGSTVALPKGTYTVWVEITDAPEKPIRSAGTMRVT